MTRPVTRPVIARDALGTLTKLGQGGQGIVYRAPKAKTKFADAMVFKEYKAQARANVSFDALSAMPAFVEDTLSDDDGKALVSISAWPCALVETSRGSVGFVMPAIPDSFYIDLTTVKGVSRTTAEFQHLLNPPSVLAARGITITDAQRYQLLREVAKALAFLHRIGVCVGDISPKNLLFSLQPRPAVYFIDCDAMRVNGVSVLPQMETPEWEVPTGEELATIYSDAYKLGLLALRLLTGDQHTHNAQQLPPTTPKLLRQLITDTLTNKPDERPLPEAWTYLLGQVIAQAQHHTPSPQTPTPPTPALTHEPEPQPVVRSRPTATPPSGKPIAAKVSAPSIRASASTPTSSDDVGKRVLAWTLLGLLVVAVLIGLVIHSAASDSGSSPSTSKSKTASVPPLVSATKLNTLMLSPASINTAMGATGMTVTSHGTISGMWPSPSQPDKSCVAVSYPAVGDDYSGTGWTAMVGQTLRGGESTSIASQNVVRFPSAEAAQAFFEASKSKWDRCSNRQLTDIYSDTGESFTRAVGPTSSSQDMLMVSSTILQSSTRTRQRALKVENNVVIDIVTDASNQPGQLAASIAQQIAAKLLD